MKAVGKNKLAVVDPVCGVQIDIDAKPTVFLSLHGHTTYFCTEKCRNEFKNEPAKYMDILKMTKNRKTWWGRYLDRVQKATNGKPLKCCQ